jgi:gamma-glutamyltranspeptidase
MSATPPFQQATIAANSPGERPAHPSNPGLVVKNGEPSMGSWLLGAGLHIRTLVCLLNAIDFGMTPQQANDCPSLACFALGSSRKLTVGAKTFTNKFLKRTGEQG